MVKTFPYAEYYVCLLLNVYVLGTNTLFIIVCLIYFKVLKRTVLFMSGKFDTWPFLIHVTMYS